MVSSIRRFAAGAVFVGLLALGMAAAGMGHGTRAENYAVPAFTCGQPVTVAITNFPSNGKQNVVTVTVKVNGVSVSSVPVSFVGSSYTYKSSVTAVSGSTYEVISTWNGNGVSGHDDSGAQKPTGACSAVTTTTTSTVPRTTTVVTTTTTPAPPTQTVTVTTPAPPAVTTTVATPAPAAPRITCHNGYVQTGAYSCLKTVTKVRTVVKWRTRTVTKTRVVVRVKRTKLTPAESCVSVKGNTWTGVCGGIGLG